MAEQQTDREDIIYALRTAHQGQMQLNLMADQKANILVGTILLLMTVLLTRLSSLELNQPWLPIVITVVTIVEVIAVALGILVIKPRTRYLKKPIKVTDMPNPLFFGFFCHLEEHEYIHYMQNLLVDNRAAHQLLLKDYYQIGQVLKRKFLLLKYAYFFAALGLGIGAVSTISYLIL